MHTEDGELGLIAHLKKDLCCDNIFPVHRLDKVTSGLLICAKTSAAASELSQLFQQRKIEKYYLAISDLKPKKKQGAIVGDMEKGRRGAWKLCHTKANPAITQFFSYHLGAGKRLFLLKPKTGKTHQLRVALKSLGSPIIGDRLYAHPQVLPLGIYLHAYSLSFTYQNTDYQYTVEPSDWGLEALEGDLRDKIKQPWRMPWPNR